MSDYSELTFVTADGRPMISEIPANPAEIDTDYISRLLQAAYDQGRQDQSEQDARIMGDALEDIRHRVEKRGAYQKGRP